MYIVSISVSSRLEEVKIVVVEEASPMESVPHCDSSRKETV